MADVAPPLIDFSPIGDLYNTYRQGRAQAAREQALAPYGGDMGLAQLMMMQQRDARDFEARRKDVGFSQGIQERQTKLAEQTAADTAKGFDYREIDVNGEKVLVKINKATGEVTRPDIAGAQTAPGNPFHQGKMNESQSKDALYTSRMLNAERVLQDPAVVGAATNLAQQGMSRIPIAGNYMVSEAFQKYDQAQRDFINAVLRRESGAVISDAEFENARKQYFPQPGDSAERLNQKKQNRLEAIKGIGAGAGPGYKPSLSIGEGGSIVENPGAKPKAATSLPRVSTPAEAAKLPKGTRFLDPNGVERIVP